MPTKIQIDTTSLQVVNFAFDTARREKGRMDENFQTTAQCIRSFINAVIFANERHIPLPGQTIGLQNPTISFWNTPSEGISVHHMPNLQTGIQHLPIGEKESAFRTLLDFVSEPYFTCAAPAFLGFQAQPAITDEFESRRTTWSRDFPNVVDELRQLVGRQNQSHRVIYDAAVQWAGAIPISQRHADLLDNEYDGKHSQIQRGEYLIAFFWDWYQRGYQYRPSATQQSSLFAYAHPLRIYGENRSIAKEHMQAIDFGNAVEIHKDKITESGKGEIGAVLPMIDVMARAVRANKKELALEWTSKGWIIPNSAKKSYTEIMKDCYRLRHGDILELKPRVKAAMSNVFHGSIQKSILWKAGMLVPQSWLEAVTRRMHSQLMTFTTLYPAVVGRGHNALIDVAMSRLTFGNEWSLVDVSRLNEIGTVQPTPPES